MELTDNFVAAIRPQALYQDRVNITRKRKTFEVHVNNSSSRSSVTLSFSDEAAMWTEVENQLPGFAEKLSASQSITDRALGRRAEAILARGAAALDSVEEKFLATIVLMHDTVIEALGAKRNTRAKIVPRRTKPSWNASLFAVASKVNLPYAVGEFYMVVSAFPCALDQQAWTMRVRLAATTNDVLYESQRRIEVARQMLAEKGILIRDTTSGTGLVDL